MPFSRRTLEEKPYNRCINCMHIGSLCDGPNFLAMELERWCEWCRLRKEYLGWTSSRLAELADVSKVSVDRIMNVNVKDLRISTMQAVTRALINGTWGQYPCVLAATENMQANTTECTKLQAEIAQLKAEHKAELEALRADHAVKITFLREQVKFKEEQMLAKDKLLEAITRMTDKERT